MHVLFMGPRRGRSIGTEQWRQLEKIHYVAQLPKRHFRVSYGLEDNLQYLEASTYLPSPLNNKNNANWPWIMLELWNLDVGAELRVSFHEWS